jgi:hypothetical protein
MDMVRSLVHVALLFGEMPGHALLVMLMVTPVLGVHESETLPEQYAWTGRMPAGAMSRTPERASKTMAIRFFFRVFSLKKSLGPVVDY